jgi:hypothetical protein
MKLPRAFEPCLSSHEASEEEWNQKTFRCSQEAQTLARDMI